MSGHNHNLIESLPLQVLAVKIEWSHEFEKKKKTDKKLNWFLLANISKSEQNVED